LHKLANLIKAGNAPVLVVEIANWDIESFFGTARFSDAGGYLAELIYFVLQKFYEEEGQYVILQSIYTPQN